MLIEKSAAGGQDSQMKKRTLWMDGSGEGRWGGFSLKFFEYDIPVDQLSSK